MAACSRQDIDSCRYLYLLDVSEPFDNSLRLLIGEGCVGEEASICGSLAGRPVEFTPDSRLFSVFWDRYLAYSVRNESHTSKDPYETFDGRIFVQYERSRYRDHLDQAVWFQNDVHGKDGYRVWGLFCQNHTINVASTSEPELALFAASDLNDLLRRSP